VLPLRASIKHHDAHHRFSNHSKNAKNYAESFWIFDALFGTRSSLTGVAVARVARASS
jgi:sterol desaturase/sphingolipid hydroxylase (fatty acid hydroxylase superfamily)